MVQNPPIDWVSRTRTVAGPDGRSWTERRELLPRFRPEQLRILPADIRPASV